MHSWWIHVGQKGFSSLSLSSSSLLTDAQNCHNPWGRPGILPPRDYWSLGNNDPLICLWRFAEASLGPCQFQALQFGWIYQRRSLPHYYTLFLISLSPPYALFSLIILHCENHKKGESYLIFTWGLFLRVVGTFLFFFFLPVAFNFASFNLCSFSPSLALSFS